MNMGIRYAYYAGEVSCKGREAFALLQWIMYITVKWKVDQEYATMLLPTRRCSISEFSWANNADVSTAESADYLYRV